MSSAVAKPQFAVLDDAKAPKRTSRDEFRHAFSRAYKAFHHQQLRQWWRDETVLDDALDSPNGMRVWCDRFARGLGNESAKIFSASTAPTADDLAEHLAHLPDADGNPRWGVYIIVAIPKPWVADQKPRMYVGSARGVNVWRKDGVMTHKRGLHARTRRHKEEMESGT